ncbi:MAG: hypothetical protein Q8Q31_02235 [Nanoarchaeota archaeon]|nr:hypothetical protein [Nanoarchaeota archaeon]
MHHLAILTTEIKRKYFPELLSVNTPLDYREFQPNLMEVRREGGLFYITVDNSLKEADRSILVGGLAYQLAKITSTIPAEKKPFFQALLDKLSKNSSLQKSEYGRPTENIVEERGLGAELEIFFSRRKSCLG